MEHSSLWGITTKGIHKLKNKSADQISKKSISGVWNNVTKIPIELQKMGIMFNDIFVKKVCVRDDTFFLEGCMEWISTLEIIFL